VGRLPAVRACAARAGTVDDDVGAVCAVCVADDDEDRASASPPRPQRFVKSVGDITGNKLSGIAH
jgi:hypothetical protein